ncbi:MAG: alkaline phosphatase D family protein [candidate division KSB1 bacterium]|nr:alkaline phosphatase D family protein [candidate division KSB1 bacterium]
MKAMEKWIRGLILCLTVFSCSYSALAAVPFQATGIRIGEVSDTRAIVWTRLTEHEKPVGLDAPVPDVYYIQPKTGKLFTREQCMATDGVRSRPDWQPLVQYPDGYDVDTIEGAVPGATGKVRVLYKPKQEQKWQMTAWQAVSPLKDYTRQFVLTDLQPNTSYALKTECKSLKGKAGETINGRFITAPPLDESDRVVFAVSTGQKYKDQDAPGGGFKIYPQILKLQPDFFVHTGDIVYYDYYAKTLPLARWHWARIYSLPTNIEFHRQVASYFIKDDHDTWMNDCWPNLKTQFMGRFTFKEGQEVFLEQFPMADSITYRTYRWGKDLQIWLVEGRDYRSPNTMPDGPEKTIWGEEQKAWFKRTVEASDATFRVLVSPTPVVGPDRTSKRDNHSNQAFAHEGQELRRFLRSQDNMVVVCGDRHWQYASRDADTGVMEFSCGPASNEHAGGWSEDQRYPEHKYLNVIGGFLAGIVEYENGAPVLIFRHYSVDGEVLNEERLTAE